MSAAILSSHECELLSDPKYRTYVAHVEKALRNFETTSEWADLISALGKLNKVLHNNTRFAIIPKRITIGKRLAQCLHPALPSGVHLKTLETYDIIFRSIGISRLAQDLFIYSAGLFPLLGHAAINVRPALLNIYEAHFVPLGQALRPSLPGLLLGIFPGLEEGSDYYDRTNALLEVLCRDTGPAFFYTCLWEVALHNPAARLPAATFVLGHVDRRRSMEDQLHIIGNNMELLTRSICDALQDANILVQRLLLDFLVLAFPLHSSHLVRDDVVRIISAAMYVLLRRDMSLNRRLYTWMLGVDSTGHPVNFGDGGATTPIRRQMSDASDAGALYFDAFSRELLVCGVRRALARHEGAPAASARPLRVLIALLDRPEIGSAILDDVLLDVVRYVRRHATGGRHRRDDEVAKTANLLFGSLEPSFVWEYVARAFEATARPEDAGEVAGGRPEVAGGRGVAVATVEELCALVDFLLDVYTLETYAETQTWHLPALLRRVTVVVTTRCGAFTERELTACLRLCSKILAKVAPSLVSDEKLSTPAKQYRRSESAEAPPGGRTTAQRTGESDSEYASCDDTAAAQADGIHGDKANGFRGDDKDRIRSDHTTNGVNVNDKHGRIHGDDATNGIHGDVVTNGIHGDGIRDDDELDLDSRGAPNVGWKTVCDSSASVAMTTAITNSPMPNCLVSTQNEGGALAWPGEKPASVKRTPSGGIAVATGDVADAPRTLMRACVDTYLEFFTTFAVQRLLVGPDILATSITMVEARGRGRAAAAAAEEDEEEEEEKEYVWMTERQRGMSGVFALACQLLLEFSCFPMYCREHVLLPRADLQNEMAAASLPSWLQVLLVFSCFVDHFPLQSCAISTLLELISLCRSIHDQHLAVRRPPAPHGGSPDTVTVLIVPILSECHLGYIDSKTDFYKIVAENLWEALDSSNQICHQRAVELLQQVHNLAPSAMICEDVIGHCLISSDQGAQVEAVKRYARLWHLTSEMHTKTKSATPTRTFDRCTFVVLDKLHDGTGPLRSAAEAWTNQALSHGDAPRLLAPLLLLLLHPDTARISLQRTPVAPAGKMITDCWDDSGDHEAKIYAISSVDGNVMYHVAKPPPLPPAPPTGRSSSAPSLASYVSDDPVFPVQGEPPSKERHLVGDIPSTLTSSDVAPDGGAPRGRSATIAGVGSKMAPPLQPRAASCCDVSLPAATGDDDAASSTGSSGDSGKAGSAAGGAFTDSGEHGETRFLTEAEHPNSAEAAHAIARSIIDEILLRVVPDDDPAPTPDPPPGGDDGQVHPAHVHLLVYRGTYDAARCLHSLSSLRALICANPRLAVCALATTGANDQRLLVALTRHRHADESSSSSSSSSSLRAQRHLETVIALCLRFARSYYATAAPPGGGPTADDVAANRRVRLAASEVLHLVAAELVTLTRDAGRAFACYIADTLAKCGARETVLRLVAACVHDARLDGGAPADAADGLAESYLASLLKVTASLVKLEAQIDAWRTDAAAENERKSEARVAAATIAGQQLFLSAVLGGLRQQHNSHLHRYWVAVVMATLPYLGASLPSVVTPTVNQVCRNLELLSHLYAGRAHLISVKNRQEELRPDHTLVLFDAITALCHFCMLEHSAPCSQLGPPGAALSVGFVHHDESTNPGQILNNLISSGSEDSAQQTRDAAVGNPVVEARRTLLSILPRILSCMATVWEAVSESERRVAADDDEEEEGRRRGEAGRTQKEGEETRRRMQEVCSTMEEEAGRRRRKEESEGCWAVGTPKAVKQRILQFLSPIALQHGHSTLAAVAVVWNERRKRHVAPANKKVLPSWCAEQLLLVDLVSSIKVIPTDTLIQVVKQVMKAPPPTNKTGKRYLAVEDFPRAEVLLLRYLLCLKVEDFLPLVRAAWLRNVTPLEVSLLQFFYAYVQRVSAAQLLDSWPSLLSLLRDGLHIDLVAPGKFLLLMIINEFVQKVPMFEDRKDQKDLQDITQRLVDACSSIAGSSLQQTTWLRRNLAVKPGPQEQPDTDPDDSLPPSAPATEEVRDSSKQADRNSQYSVQALFLLAEVMAPLLDAVYGSEDKDKVAPLLMSVMTHVTPYLKNHSAHNAPSYRACSRLLASVSEYQYTRRAWRREVFELLLEPAFFQTDAACLHCWRGVVDHLMTQDKTTFKDLMGRVAAIGQSASLNLFTSREAESELRSQLLKKLSFTIFSSELDQYQSYMPDMQERLAECLRIAQVPSIQAQVFLCFRILLLRMSPQQLVSLWPTIITEMVHVFLQVEQELSTDTEEFKRGNRQHLKNLGALDSSWTVLSGNGLNAHNNPQWLHLYLSVCKLLDLALVLPSDVQPQFQMYKWTFVGEQTTERKYQKTPEFEPHCLRIAHLLNSKRPETSGVRLPGGAAGHPVLTATRIASLHDLQSFFNTICNVDQSASAYHRDASLSETAYQEAPDRALGMAVSRPRSLPVVQCSAPEDGETGIRPGAARLYIDSLIEQDFAEDLS